MHWKSSWNWAYYTMYPVSELNSCKHSQQWWLELCRQEWQTYICVNSCHCASILLGCKEYDTFSFRLGNCCIWYHPWTEASGETTVSLSGRLNTSSCTVKRIPTNATLTFTTVPLRSRGKNDKQWLTWTVQGVLFCWKANSVSLLCIFFFFSAKRKPFMYVLWRITFKLITLFVNAVLVKLSQYRDLEGHSGRQRFLDYTVWPSGQEHGC